MRERDHKKRVQAAMCSDTQQEMTSPAFASQVSAEYTARAINFYRGGQGGEKGGSFEISPNWLQMKRPEKQMIPCKFQFFIYMANRKYRS